MFSSSDATGSITYMRMKRPCILVYNPISGHGHLDSWNAIFIAILLGKGWDVLALTPDISALLSRLTQKGIANSPHLHILEPNMSVTDIGCSIIRLRLQRAWHWWNSYGSSYYYHLPGSEATTAMPFLIYWKKRLFQRIVPPLFRASHLLYSSYHRIRKLRNDSNDCDKQEDGYLHPPDFAARISRALQTTPLKPALILNMYMDMYRSSTDSWNKFAALNTLPWAGIRFVPSDFPVEGYYSLTSLRGMCFLDEKICSVYQKKIPHKFFEYLPDITETSLPDQPSELAQEIRQRAAGRKIVFMGGSIGSQKNLTRWYELIALADPERWFFVQIGELHRGALTAEDKVSLEKVLSTAPENILLKDEYIPDERTFNDIIRTVDIIFAVYRDFRISSNMLNKAAAFKKPILVADNYLMGERVRTYGIGKTVPQDDVNLIYGALMSLEDADTFNAGFDRYRKDFDNNALETRLTRFIEKCIGNP